MSDDSLNPPDWVKQLGAVPWPTLGGKQMWGDVFLYGGWRIQKNAVTKLYRLLDPRDVRHAAGDWEHCHTAFARLRAERGIGLRSNHLVLLLHGYFRSKDSFNPMTRALQEAGFEAHGVNYPSTRQGLLDHAGQVSQILERAQGVDTVSFVTHSMGGIVARVLLADKEASWRRRITPDRLVMIATPNRGAELAQRIAQLPAHDTVVGPSMRQLTPDEAARIPAPDIPFGIVAGVRGDGRGFNPLLDGEDDMTVSLQSTLLDGAEDTLLVKNAVHTFIMVHPAVIQSTVRYLRTGSFAHQGDDSDEVEAE